MEILFLNKLFMFGKYIFTIYVQIIIRKSYIWSDKTLILLTINNF